MTYSPTVPGGGVASYKLQPVFTYNNGYWEVYRRFQGDFFGFGGRVEGGGYVGGSFLGEICHGWKKFNEKGAGFSSITIKKNNEKINMKTFFQMKVRNSIEI